MTEPIPKPRAAGMIAAAEVWVPLDDESGLELYGGVYGPLDPLRLAHEGLVLPGGEGLAGQSWSRQVPLLAKDLSEVSPTGEAALTEASVGAAVALPVFDHGQVGSVLVLYLRGGPGAVGAAELWTGRRGRFELSTAGGYYAGLDRFGEVAAYVNFPMGSGLPGKVWQAAAPCVMDELCAAPEFMRSSGAESAGLDVGFGVPTISGGELKGVLVLLSSDASPIARAYEVWRPVMTGHAPYLERSAGVYRGLPTFEKSAKGLSFQPGEGLPGKAWGSRKPELMSRISDADTRRARAAAADGLDFAAAIPVIINDEVRSIAMLAWS